MQENRGSSQVRVVAGYCLGIHTNPSIYLYIYDINNNIVLTEMIGRYGRPAHMFTTSARAFRAANHF